jgi:hypothetical protein
MLSFGKQANILSKLNLLSLTQHGKNRHKNLLTILLKTLMRNIAPLSYVTYFTNTILHDPHNPLRELSLTWGGMCGLPGGASPPK